MVDLRGLSDPRTALEEIAGVMPADRVLVVTALGTIPSEEIRGLRFHVITRPSSAGTMSSPRSSASKAQSDATADDYAGSPAIELLRLRNNAIAAGIVVAAPIETSVTPNARRRDSGIFDESSNPIPTPSAALVATMKANVGLLSSKVFMVMGGRSKGEAARRYRHAHCDASRK